jgi:hypothetical protein
VATLALLPSFFTQHTGEACVTMIILLSSTAVLYDARIHT